MTEMKVKASNARLGLEMTSERSEHQSSLSEFLDLVDAVVSTYHGPNSDTRGQSYGPYKTRPLFPPSLASKYRRAMESTSRSREECSLQLIDENGTFNGTRLDNFIKQVQLAQCGVSYFVISIIGPQSSGKSTLLNHLFGTNFREMNALDGKSQTTKGIWLANCVGIEPRTIVMDVEGTDGRERGQDDTAFEKQSALFALAVSDILLLNMWCNDIGREQAANKPLLRTVFQVMMTLFSPRKVTLIFVIRDKSKTPLEKLASDLTNDIETIWDSVPKPQAHKQTPLREFFNVKVVAFPSYERDEDLFKKEVATLRQKFFHSKAHGWLAGDRQGVVPASGFSSSAELIWGVIKENKDLNLPKHKVMVAKIRCEEISKEKFAWFSQNKDWCKIQGGVQSGPVSGFGMKLSLLLKTCLSDYDAEATFYDEGVRNEKRKKLEEKLLLLFQSAYTSIMMNIKSKALLEFKKAFGEALKEKAELPVAVSYCTTASMARFEQLCTDADIRLTHWGTSNKIVKDELQHEINDIAAHISDVLADAKQDRKYVKRFITGAAIAGQFALGNFTSVLGLLGGSAVGAGVAEAVGSKMKKSAIKEAIEEIGQGSGC